MTKKIITLVSFFLLASPIAVLAIIFPPTPAGTGFNLLLLINAVLNLIWPIFIGVSVIMFILAGFEFITAEGEVAKLKLARDSVIYGVIGLVVGIIAFSLPIFIARWFAL